MLPPCVRGPLCTVKRAVLVLFVLQTTSYVLLIRYSKVRSLSESNPAYASTETVFMGEVFKLVACLVMVGRAAGGIVPALVLLRTELGSSDTLKCAVPAVAYTLQSNLMFVALTNLSAPIFQVTYQTRTLFTALFSRLLLSRALSWTQWLSLLLLVAGASLASDLGGGGGGDNAKESAFVGLAAVLGAALLSSSSSVYFELILKKAPGTAAAAAAGLWLRNVQLGLFATPLAAAAVLVHDGARVGTQGILAGFDAIVWLIAIDLGIGGLLVAATMKYADNIIKCFATALAVLSGTLLSVPLFAFQLTRAFALGAACVIGATCLYSWVHTVPPPEERQSEQQPLRGPSPSSGPG